MSLSVVDFPAPFSADQADPLAGIDGQLGVGENLQVAKLEGDFVEAK